MAPKGSTDSYAPTHHYAEVSRINSHVLAYESHLLTATSTGVCFFAGFLQQKSESAKLFALSGAKAIHCRYTSSI
jgi:hypothetical protein